ncbi:Protein of unknown function [Bacillus cereus]|nr:Protein of unknown function [Bacillus cereus]
MKRENELGGNAIVQKYILL